MSSKHNIKVICPNCDHEISGDDNYCPNCGQANKLRRLNFKFIVSDFLAANFNLDSKILVTLKLLLISPATLTVEFMAGKRMKYISPIRLYLLISFIYFFIVSIDPSSEKRLFDTNNNVQSDSADRNNIEINDNTLLDSLDQDSNEDAYFEQTLMGKAKMLNTEAGSLVFHQLFRKYTSVGMFVLIPLTALLFFMLFSRGTYYIQHLIFSFHLQSLVFILFIVFNILGWVIKSDVLDYIEWSLFFIALFVWMKKYYKRSYVKTLWKLFLFLNGYLILFIFFFAVVLLLSFINLDGIKT